MGCIQEEIRFVINAELLCSLLFTAEVNEKENVQRNFLNVFCFFVFLIFCFFVVFVCFFVFFVCFIFFLFLFLVSLVITNLF